MGIEQLLRPRSIAIVGASDRIGPGFNAWNALQHVAYEGEIYLVNPTKPQLFGHRTYSSIEELPDTIDAAFLAVGADKVIESARQAVSKGAGSLAILASGFGEAGEFGVKAQNELALLARQNSLAICGPNCLGLLNFAGKSALFGTSLPDHVDRGGIAAVVQSGSIGIALLNSARGVGLSHLITTGNEAVTTAADYLETFIEDPEVSACIVFAEQIRNPKKFIDVLRRLRAADKPVIVLKSGRSELGQAAVLAHTGAVAGSREAATAALRAAGAIQVDSLDELVETAALVSQMRRRPTQHRIGALSLSGGEIALVLDAAEDCGAEFASVEGSKEQIRKLLPEFAHIANPLDLTWAGLYDPAVARGCALALGSQPNVGILALIQDAPMGLGPQQSARYAALLASVAEGAEQAAKPLVAISNLAGEPHPTLAAAAHRAKIPYLRGTREGLSALTRFGRWVDRNSDPVPNGPHHGFAQAASRLNGLPNRLPGEHEARHVLESYGVKGPGERMVQTADDAAKAAAELGFPVALKCIVAGMVHKSDAGLVAVGLRSTEEVRDAATGMMRKSAELDQGAVLGLLVQEKASPIAELFLGAKIDPEYGPIIVVGAGGLLVELYRDVAVRLAPINEASALEALAETRISRALDGWRGKPRADMHAIANNISALSHFIADFRDEVAEVEVNPLAALAEGKGAIALDCVIITRKSDA